MLQSLQPSFLIHRSKISHYSDRFPMDFPYQPQGQPQMASSYQSQNQQTFQHPPSDQNNAYQNVQGQIYQNTLLPTCPKCLEYLVANGQLLNRVALLEIQLSAAQTEKHDAEKVTNYVLRLNALKEGTTMIGNEISIGWFYRQKSYPKK